MNTKIDEILIGVSDTRRLIDAIKTYHDIDISNYALTSLKRRIKRSMSLNEFTSFDSLLLKIPDNEFFSKFLSETSIEVTEMFRDPSFWRDIKNKVIPDILSRFDSVNVWIPDFSSGDEIFSLAIIAKEEKIWDRLNIHATCMHHSLYNSENFGQYSMRKHEVSLANYQRVYEKESFERYYTLDKFGYTMKKDLLEKVSFGVCDLSKSSINQSFNLIIARNILLYFNSNLHDNVVSLFYKHLHKGGYLAIGIQETIEFCRDSKRFTPAYPSEKIYKKLLI